MRFVLPLPPNRANARGHWRKIHRDKTAYWEQLDRIQLVGGGVTCFTIPRPPREPLPQATAAATLYVWAPMDEGNALNRLKWTEDWLVSRGYLADDNRKALRWAAIPEQVVDRRNQRIVLTLEAA